MSDTPTSRTTPPWAGNRYGDPRQLVHEANALEADARGRREHANYLRRMAVECEAAADRLDDAARDYREWARQETTL